MPSENFLVSFYILNQFRIDTPPHSRVSKEVVGLFAQKVRFFFYTKLAPFILLGG